MGLSSVMIYLLDYSDGLCTKNVPMIDEHKRAISEKNNPKITHTHTPTKCIVDGKFSPTSLDQ